MERRGMSRNITIDSVIILDDEPDYFPLYLMRLGRYVRHIVTVETLEELYKKLGEQTYSFIILDYLLYGEKIAPHIKEIASKANGAKIYVSTNYDVDKVRNSINGDVSAVFGKDQMDSLNDVLSITGMINKIKAGLE